eukprot:2748542-Heterocapsa_arctica.AAC.1
MCNRAAERGLCGLDFDVRAGTPVPDTKKFTAALPPGCYNYCLYYYILVILLASVSIGPQRGSEASALARRSTARSGTRGAADAD